MSTENNENNNASQNDLLTTQDLSQISEILNTEFGDDEPEKKKEPVKEEKEPKENEKVKENPEPEEEPEDKTEKEEPQPETVGTAPSPETEKEPESIGQGAPVKTPKKGLPKKNKKKDKKGWKTGLKYALITILILAVAGAIGVFVLYRSNFKDISGTNYVPKEKTKIYTADNVEIASLFSENRTYVSLDQVPKDLKEALIATEDSRFYSHGGVDYWGILRAFVSNLASGSSTGQGASTLTQQLARILYLPDISTEQTFMDSLNRKFKEISIARQLESKYTKDQILEMYLNEYYFGSGAYGVEAASETYFGKPVSQLNLAECAMIAGLPQAPSSYAPNNDFDAAKKRQKEVLQRMVAMKDITQEEADQAYNQPLDIKPWSPSSLDNQITTGYANYVNKVMQEIAEASAPNLMKQNGMSEDEAIASVRGDIASGGYVIYTTLYSSYQNDAIDTAASKLASYGYDSSSGDTCAIVSIDLDGAVRCYYGGDENHLKIDMADEARQPGSNIKPLYYSYGLESGTFTVNSILNDQPTSYGGYSPRNYGGTYSGNITFAQSLIQSKNVTSVQVFNTIGVDNALKWIKTFGITTLDDDMDASLAVATGGLTYGIKPLQMAAAFNVFNNSGVYNQPYYVTKVTDSTGETILSKDQLGLDSHRVMSETTAQTMWGLMRQIVTSSTGASAATSEPTAGKTGTTDNEEDLWFTGMTGNITTTVWLGNTDHQVMGGTSGQPASIYGTYMQTLLNENMIHQYNENWPPAEQNHTDSYQGPDADKQDTQAAA